MFKPSKQEMIALEIGHMINSPNFFKPIFDKLSNHGLTNADLSPTVDGYRFLIARAAKTALESVAENEGSESIFVPQFLSWSCDICCTHGVTESTLFIPVYFIRERGDIKISLPQDCDFFHDHLAKAEAHARKARRLQSITGFH